MSDALIPCSEAVRRLWDYLEGTATPADHDRLDKHLAFCQRCCGELEFIRHLRELLVRQRRDELPSPLIERLEMFVEGIGR